MHNHTGCICKTFPLSVFSNASSNGLHGKRHSHIALVAFVRFFPTATVSLCVLNESSNWMPERKHKHTGCICSAFLRYVSSSDPTQIACMRRCMLTFAAVA